MGLSDKKSQEVSTLTIAELKRLEVARALATNPKLLLLDEVMAGLTPSEARDAVAMVRRLHESGTTLFVIEHVMDVIMPISHRVVVLDAGQKITEGKPHDVVNDERVIKAYLGRRRADSREAQGPYSGGPRSTTSASVCRKGTSWLW